MEEFIREMYGQEGNMNNLESITPSGFFGSDKDRIIKIDKFIKPEELNYIYEFSKKLEDWVSIKNEYDKNSEPDFWDKRVSSSELIYKNDPEIVYLIEKLNSRLKKIIKEEYKVNANPTGIAIARWFPGNFQMPHADKEIHSGPDKGKPNNFPFYDIGSLYYINDDYEGGEIYFPNQDLEFKPVAGSACFFPGDLNYIHGVREIKSGIRYTSPTFWHITEHY